MSAQMEQKNINQEVKRYINKFPKRYMLQFGTSSLNNYERVRKLPYVFTEQVLAMITTILRIPVADRM